MVPFFPICSVCCLFIQILLKCTDLLKHKQMSLDLANQIILGKKSIFTFLQVTKNVSQTYAGKFQELSSISVLFYTPSFASTIPVIESQLSNGTE